MIPQPRRRMKLGQNYLAYLHLCTTLAQARPAQIVPIGLMQPVSIRLGLFVCEGREQRDMAVAVCLRQSAGRIRLRIRTRGRTPKNEEDQMCPSRSPKFPILGSPQFPRNKSPGGLFARVNCGRPTLAHSPPRQLAPVSRPRPSPSSLAGGRSNPPNRLRSARRPRIRAPDFAPARAIDTRARSSPRSDLGMQRV